jgi:hypothetical protein
MACDESLVIKQFLVNLGQSVHLLQIPSNEYYGWFSVLIQGCQVCRCILLKPQSWNNSDLFKRKYSTK